MKRTCPQCRNRFDEEHQFCPNDGFPLHDLPLEPDEVEPPPPPQPDPSPQPDGPRPNSPEEADLRCPNGHPVHSGDRICIQCGASLEPRQPAPGPTPASLFSFAGFELGERIPVASGCADFFPAHRTADNIEGIAKVYRPGSAPEQGIHAQLAALRIGSLPRVLAHGEIPDGEYAGRTCEITEKIEGLTLANTPRAQISPARLRGILTDVTDALHELHRHRILHRNLRPDNIFLRRDPPGSILTGFSQAVISDLGMRAGTPETPTRHTAPEAAVGAYQEASDWWSLGVILLETLVGSAVFAGATEMALVLQAVTRGVEVPQDIDANWRELLCGLLTRDPHRRWNADQVRRWITGERGIPTGYEFVSEKPGAAHGLILAGNEVRTVFRFALEGATQAGWDDAMRFFERGRLASWLEENAFPPSDLRIIDALRSADNLEADLRLALALMVLNPHLPLCIRGQIVTPEWLVADPTKALKWLGGPLPKRLERMGREPWLVELAARVQRCHHRRRIHRLPIEEAALNVLLLTPDAGKLLRLWQDKRRGHPEATHPALRASAEKTNPSAEELALLLAAPEGCFRDAATILADAGKEARKAAVPFDSERAQTRFQHSQAELRNELGRLVEGFVRCGNTALDEWADTFRLEGRLPLPRLLVMLGTDPDSWQQPPRQDYTNRLLAFFHRRLFRGIQRGPLLNLRVTQSSQAIDLHELGTQIKPARQILNTIVSRSEQPAAIDPTAIRQSPELERRARRLLKSASDYQRDTGIDALYLGFPLVVMRETSAEGEGGPRLAPLLLWPLQLSSDAGARGQLTVGFDNRRERIDLNQALISQLPTEMVDRLGDAIEELLGHSNLEGGAVIDLCAQAMRASPERELQAIPRPLPRPQAGSFQLLNSAALFLCDFFSHTIATDIQHLIGRPLDGCALAPLLKIRNEPHPPAVEAAQVPQIDRYFVMDADPSQQRAVFRARQAPGLVVQGPPGTGKSQTIVNVVADSIGRGERVLLVCQKQAAIDVVSVRLDAEGLGGRFLTVADARQCRRPIIQALREQLSHRDRWPTGKAAQKEREAAATQIDRLETLLGAYHDALHAEVHQSGLTYGQILGELLRLNTEGNRGPGVAFRPLFCGQHHADVTAAIEQVAPLAQLWLEADFEDNPLRATNQIATDDASLDAFRDAFHAHAEAERARSEVLAEADGWYGCADLDALRHWLQRHGADAAHWDRTLLDNLRRWHDLAANGEVATLLARLLAIVQAIQTNQPPCLVPEFDEPLIGLDDEELDGLCTATETVMDQQLSPWRFLSFSYLGARSRVRRFLRDIGMDPREFPNLIEGLAGHSNFEVSRREWGRGIAAISERLQLPSPDPATLHAALLASGCQLVAHMQALEAAWPAVRDCPLPEEFRGAISGDSADAIAAFLLAARNTVRLGEATAMSLATLQNLSAWMSSAWIDDVDHLIRHAEDATHRIAPLAASLPSLESFQKFRLRHETLSDLERAIFLALRTRRDDLREIPAETLAARVCSMLREEAHLAWKLQAEQANAALTLDRAELDSRIGTLQAADDRMRKANRSILQAPANPEKVAREAECQRSLMLTGPNARRLREIVDAGLSWGLMELRPIWLANPETVSRVFPLQEGLFDLVIFDEASQIPLEMAIPSLYRARRVVVCGDHKQLPPTSFFRPGHECEFDGDDGTLNPSELEALIEQGEEEERNRRLEALSRREVKDCDDLLALAVTSLPEVPLTIHYRSRYRPLIAFSNAAFYGDRLSVPVHHPEAEIRRRKPLEVRRVDGTYHSNTNREEAVAIVALLADVWARQEPPTVGVVTFNVSQSELIQELIEARTASDPAFRSSYARESNRRLHSGELAGFFVKNLENVQGDERDLMIFSTTYGRDPEGRFLRNFGPLSQAGGERRLNVAITRARERLVIFTSMPVEEIAEGVQEGNPGPRHVLKAYLSYAEAISSGDLDSARAILDLSRRHSADSSPSGPIDVATASGPSPLAEVVADFLAGLGLQPVHLDGRDAFRFDIGIVHPKTGLYHLAVECDPPHHPDLNDARARDLWRPRVLGQTVGRLVKIRSRDWLHDPEAEKQRLREAVAALL